MRYCPNCNAPIEDDSSFCVYCGTKISGIRTCPLCGNVIDSNSKFCTHCGNKIGDFTDNVRVEETKQECNPQNNVQGKVQGLHPTGTTMPENEEEKSGISNMIVWLIVFATILVVGLLAYFALDAQEKEDAHEKVYQEKLVAKRAKEKARKDSINAARIVAVKEAKRLCFYGDGPTYDVRGHVKSVDYIMFEKDGKAYLEYGSTTFIRNKKGQIVEIDPGDPDDHPFFTYNKDGRVQTMTDHNPPGEDCECSEIIYTYQYDIDGYVCSYTKKKNYSEGNYIEISNPKEFTNKFSVEILEMDSHKNWTKRRVAGVEIFLETTGDDYAGTGVDGSEVYYVRKNIDRIEERTIEYYD